MNFKSNYLADIGSTFLGIVIVFAFMIVAIALPVWLLWNVVVPDVFGLKQINFWQAMALSGLAACFFKSTSRVNEK